MDETRSQRLLLSPEQAAEALSIRRSKMYQLIASGQIPSVRLGKRAIRVPADALQQWVQRQVTTSTES